MRQIIILSLLLITLSSCLDKFCREDVPPQIRTTLEIKKGGKNVADSELKTAYLYWLENGIKTIDSNRYPNQTEGIAYPLLNDLKHDSTKPLFYSTQIAYISARGVKAFYLAYPNGTIDTLTIDYQNNSSKQGRCTYTSISLNEIKYKGTKAQLDTALESGYEYGSIYIINK